MAPIKHSSATASALSAPNQYTRYCMKKGYLIVPNALPKKKKSTKMAPFFVPWDFIKKDAMQTRPASDKRSLAERYLAHLAGNQKEH